MAEINISFWLPIILAVIASIPGIMAYAKERSAIQIERETSALDGWRTLLDPLRDRVATLEVTVSEQDVTITNQAKRIRDLEKYVKVLEDQADTASRLVTAYGKQLLDLGHTPNAHYIEQLRIGVEKDDTPHG